MSIDLTRPNADVAALVLRLALGVMFLAHAGLKVFTFSLPGTAQFFASVGFPGWAAYLVFAAEVVGGLLLLAGATWVHWPNGWVFTAQGGGWEYPAFLIVASLVQVLLGDGAFALRGGTGRAGLVASGAR
ncbi:MAG: DoxX family protein [Alphaproteobacteria bacterium]